MGGPIHDEQMRISVFGRTKQRSNIGHPPCAFGARGSSSEPGCSLCGHGLSEAQDLLRKGSLNSPVATYSGRAHNCDNLVFHRRAAVDELTQRLLDLNRTIGQPKKITLIFGRRVTKHYRGKLQTEIEDLDLPNPVIRSHYGSGFVKQYVRDDRLVRTEPATNSVYDYGVNKRVEHLPELRDRMSAIIDNYHNVQQ